MTHAFPTRRSSELKARLDNDGGARHQGPHRAVRRLCAARRDDTLPAAGHGPAAEQGMTTGLGRWTGLVAAAVLVALPALAADQVTFGTKDRKSTRLNSSH